MQIKTTVCKIAAAPHAFYKKRVTVEACVTTDGIEHTALTDKDCPYMGIGLTESIRLRPRQRLFPERDKQVCGTFSGVFQASTMIETNVLEVDETSHLRTIPVRSP
jgi:hypothetical protein